MSKAISALRLANKTYNTLRLVGGTYQPYLLNERLRYESLNPISTGQRIDDNAIERSLLCSYYAMVNHVDLLLGDRIEVLEDNRTFVVVGMDDFDELNVSHHEVLLRLLNSQVHETIEIKRLSGDQDGYDPVLKQWSSAKNFTSQTVLALVDRVRSGDTGIKSSAGLMEGSEYRITLELPDRVTVQDTIVIKGIEYHITQVEDLPYQSFVYVAKKLPHGKQFT